MFADEINEKKFVQLFGPVAATADQNGTVDLNGYNAASIVFNLGAEGITLSGTDKIAATIQHSDDNSTWVAVGASDIIIPKGIVATGLAAPDTNGVVFTADANAKIPAVFGVGYRGAKRYLKAIADYSGTHGTATPVSALAILEEPNFDPAS